MTPTYYDNGELANNGRFADHSPVARTRRLRLVLTKSNAQPGRYTIVAATIVVMTDLIEAGHLKNLTQLFLTCPSYA
jgi:hypothetical protein